MIPRTLRAVQFSDPAFIPLAVAGSGLFLLFVVTLLSLVRFLLLYVWVVVRPKLGDVGSWSKFNPQNWH